MARLTSEIKFEGTIGELSAYRMAGSDKIIVRRKGGPSKNKIMRSHNFVNVRRNISEFGLRSKATRYLNDCIRQTRQVADYNITGALNATLRPVQHADDRAWGMRQVLLSKNPKILDGFSFNHLTPIESIIRNPIIYTLSRETMSATVTIPELIHGITFNPQQRFSMFRVFIELGVMPDILRDEHYAYPSTQAYSVSSSTAWLPARKGCVQQTLAVTLDDGQPNLKPGGSFSLILSVAVQYGVMEGPKTFKIVKPGGGAKILATA